MSDKRTRVEDLYQEFERDGHWFWFPKNNYISPERRQQAYDYLAENPDRYFYPPSQFGRVRISYRER